MKRISLIPVLLLALLQMAPLLAAPPAGRPAGTGAEDRTGMNLEVSSMKIRLIVDGRAMTATLIDSPTTRDFLGLLPITLTLEDYAGTEKIAYLPRKLAEEGAPAGVDPSVGDITYYAPWGNLALFYKDFGYAKGLIKLGHLDEGAEAFDVPGSVTVTIEAW